MLVGVVAPGQRAGVQTGFVGESRCPHIGLLRVGSEVDQLRHLMRHAGETLQPAFGQSLNAELELQIGDDRDEVAVAGAFAVAVDRALHLSGSASHSSQGVGHAAACVVVEVHADRSVKIVADSAHDFAHLMRQRAAVRVAEHQPVGAGICCGRQHLQGVFGVVDVAVKEVLGVKEHPHPLLAQVSHRFRHHGDALLQRHPQGFGHMVIPSLADNAHHRAVGSHQIGQSGVAVGFAVGPPGGAESHQGARLQIKVGFGLGEEFVVFGVGAGPAAFYVIHAQIIQPTGDAKLVVYGEGDAFQLAAVAQGRVVDFHRIGHCGGEVACSVSLRGHIRSTPCSDPHGRAPLRCRSLGSGA